MRALSASARSAQDDEDENAEADPDFREGKLAWAGGRGEMKSYEAGDREDRAAAAAARAALRRRDADPEARRRAAAHWPVGPVVKTASLCMRALRWA